MSYKEFKKRFHESTTNLMPQNSLITSEGKFARQKRFKLTKGQKPVDEQQTFNDLTDALKRYAGKRKNRGFLICFTYDNKLSWCMNKHFQTLDDIEFMSFFAMYERRKVEDKITAIDLYYVDLPSKNKGGRKETIPDPYNNCLYYALKSFLGDKMKDKQPSLMKRYLKIENDEGVHWNLLPLLEERYKINIYLKGDFTYDSCKKYSQSCYLTLINGHYEPNRPKFDKSYIKFKKPAPLLLTYSKNGQVYFYNGEEELTEKPKTAHVVQCDVDDKEDYFKSYTEQCRLMTLNTKYNPLEFKDLKELVKKIIYMTYKNVDFEPIQQDEEEIIKMVGMSACRYAEPGTYKNVSSIDMNRFYSSLQSNINIPIGKPTFTKLNELPEILKPGFYKVKIKTKCPFFTYNKYNWYTQYSIYQARDNDPTAEFSIIDNEEFNAVMYPPKYTNTNKFNDIYKTLYVLGKGKCKIAKLVANMIWGTLNQRNFKREKLTENGAKLFNPNTDTIKFRTSCYVGKFFNPNSYFKFPYARSGPFITSKGRREIVKSIYKTVDNPLNIKYIHTDGFLCVDLSKSFKSSQDMGKLRLDKLYGEVEVLNKNQYHEIK